MNTRVWRNDLYAWLLRTFSTSRAAAGGPQRVAGSGVAATETRSARGFTSLELAAVGAVRFSSGPDFSLSVTADDNILPQLLSEVLGGNLILRAKPNVQLDPKTPIVYSVVAPSLDRLKLSGAGEIIAENLPGERLELMLSGAGDMTLSGVRVTFLSAKLSGTGKMKLTGAAAVQDLSLPGVGTLQAYRLEGAEVRVELSGSGDAHVWATASLSASIPGVRVVRYRGEPAVKAHVSGVGSVTASDSCP